MSELILTAKQSQAIAEYKQINSFTNLDECAIITHLMENNLWYEDPDFDAPFGRYANSKEVKVVSIEPVENAKPYKKLGRRPCFNGFALPVIVTLEDGTRHPAEVFTSKKANIFAALEIEQAITNNGGHVSAIATDGTIISRNFSYWINF